MVEDQNRDFGLCCNGTFYHGTNSISYVLYREINKFYL